MSRYVPTADEKAAIDRLTLAGYKVVREGTYAALIERVRHAEAMQRWETERRESNEAWARDCHKDERRLADRLNEVCYAAAALGVSIQDINTALAAGDVVAAERQKLSVAR